MIERIGRNRKVVTAATIAGLLALGAGAAIAEEPGGCYKTGIPAPVVLPDGSAHPAGELRICMTRRLSPVEWLHVIYVRGAAIGAFRGREGRIERGIEPGPPEIVFLREADGSLRLFGLTTCHAAGARLHRLIPSGALMAESAVEGGPAKTGRPEIVTVTAARR